MLRRFKLSNIAAVAAVFGAVVGAGCSDLTTTTATQTVAPSVVVPTTTIDPAANRATVPVTDPAIIASVISEVGGLTQLTFTPEQQTCLTSALTTGVNPTTMAALRKNVELFDLPTADRAVLLDEFDGCITAADYTSQLAPHLVAAGSSKSAANCAYTQLRTLGFAKLVDYAGGLTSDDGPDPTLEASVSRIFKECGVKTDATAPPQDTEAPTAAPGMTESPDPSAGPLDTTANS